MDVLSEVLRVVRLDGAVFYYGEYSAPWSFLSPHSSAMAGYVAPAARHVIVYHLLTEGRGYARVGNGPPLPLAAGDVVVFPHGHGHTLGNGSPVTAIDHGKEVERIMKQGLKVSRMGGGGEVTRFVCGYLACDPFISKVLLNGLPALFKVNIRNEASGSWLESSIRFAVADAGQGLPGGEAVLAKLSEALFVETLRRYLVRLPSVETGWLAGARDPEVGKALALMHQSPGHPWTVANLAHQAGISRSVLAERFQQFVGEPPMAYLTRWRLQVAAQRLTTTSDSLLKIAGAAGYQSEAAFNRAFKREFGLPPAKFRGQTKVAGRVSASRA